MKEGVTGGDKAYLECDVGWIRLAVPSSAGPQELEVIIRTLYIESVVVSKQQWLSS